MSRPNVREGGSDAEEQATRVLGFGGFVVLGFVLGALVLYAFAWLADEVLGQETLVLDNAVSAYLQQFSSAWLTTVALGVSFLGSEAIWVFGAILLVVFARQRLWGAAMSLVVITAGAQLLNNVLKDVFHRTRPAPVLVGIFSAQQFSFPSGHAMVSMAFYFYVGYFGWRLLSGAKRVLLVLVLAILVILIGVSRIYLGVHYLSDVIAGYLAGFLWTDMVILGSNLHVWHPVRRVHSA